MDLLDASHLPDRFASVEALDEFMTRPSRALVDDLDSVDGDLMILGVAGKMGPTLARLAKRASPSRRVIGVARFSDAAVRAHLTRDGIETIACDLLDRNAIAALPDVANVVFAAGHKFGASGAPALTWAMNAHVPALVAERFHASRIVAFSTGNVYGFSAAGGAGASETTPPAPVGEYAQSCLGRERMFEYFSAKHGTPGRIVRLNYEIDMRYGVLFDIASKVHRGERVDATMGHVNVIWQGDANAQVLRCLAHCTAPTTPLNVTGPHTLSVRELAHQLASRLGTEAHVVGKEAATALLSNTANATALFGPPVVPLGRMLDWVADWVKAGGASLGKPTKFEVRDGTF
ncbi:MAG TPA: NAD(P)-dependent oxidoreductase [Caldimonas sp.]|nr:NAD(P)-dependent oxidoreductase [Caldimonas sp.]HEX4233530.1 NAD(P)-dependent oxidoreductase [Caldimonas sp.]